MMGSSGQDRTTIRVPQPLLASKLCASNHSWALGARCPEPSSAIVLVLSPSHLTVYKDGQYQSFDKSDHEHKSHSFQAGPQLS